MNYSDKILLNNKIKNLQNKEHYIKIYKIIKKFSPDTILSYNKNGIHFDLNELDELTLDLIRTYINNISLKVQL
jgi:predicted transcriptional regulator